MHDWSEREVRDELYKRMININGIDGQLTKLCEELAELIQITCKIKQLKNPKDVKNILLFHKLLDEVVDVEVMSEQLLFILYKEFISSYSENDVKKLLRQKKKDKLSNLVRRIEAGEFE